MDIALDNINTILDVRSPEILTANLRRVFSKLLDPTQDRVLVLKYTVTFFWSSSISNSLPLSILGCYQIKARGKKSRGDAC